MGCASLPVRVIPAPASAVAANYKSHNPGTCPFKPAILFLTGRGCKWAFLVRLRLRRGFTRPDFTVKLDIFRSRQISLIWLLHTGPLECERDSNQKSVALALKVPDTVPLIV